MAARNPDAVTGQGEFHARVLPPESPNLKWHKPGTKAGPGDLIPEFHAQTLPAGSAPPERTFAPDSTSETPTTASAEATLSGSTSADVHKGIGMPVMGQTSHEARHHAKPRDHESGVAAQYGTKPVDLNYAKEGFDERQRQLE